MGIRVDFLIKHVRPYGMNAFQMVCGDVGPNSLRARLVASGVAPQNIDLAFNSWAALGLIGINNASIPRFVKAARIISQARWDQLYATNFSSIMFLNQPLHKELSYDSSLSASAPFVFDPFETIPLVGTISRDPNVAASVNLSVPGAHLAADENGNCFHFDSLLDRPRSLLTMRHLR